jgi:hypothetical protein
MNAAVTTIRSEFLKATRWFDPDWYLRRQPAARQAAEPLAHYLEHGIRAGIGPNRYLDDLQRSCGESANPPAPVEDPRSTFRAEVALIAASGLFNPSYYLESNPDVAAKGGDPLHHFCRHGWRQLRRPNPDFDVWWYWSCHLDPAQDTVNPLVHYILVGQAAGLRGQPPPYRPGPGHVLAPGARVRRICLLAGHDPDGVVDDYVVELARALSRFADVYYLGDCVMRDGQLEKLDRHVSGRWAYRHGMYDFGSWSALAGRHVGWDIIEQYDELLLVNDSNYLIGALAPVFAKMHAKACDWWGLQATKGMFPTRDRIANRFEAPIPLRQVRSGLIDGYVDDGIYDFHVGSYFVALRAPVIADPGFRRRLAAVCPQRSKAHVVRKYEMGLTQYLVGRQFAFDTFIDDLHPLHPVFTNRQFDLIKQGFPLFKRMFLISNHYDVPGLVDWKDKLRAVSPDAPVDMIKRNLQRVADHEKLHRSFAITEDDAGRTVLPILLTRAEFLKADAETQKFDHWWAFAVDPVTGALAGDERAVFEAVRNDPSIRKTVLTRWRKLEFDGPNVATMPLRSPEGQYHLLRSRQVFAGPHPERTLAVPLSPLLHNLLDPRCGTNSAGAKGRPRLDIVSCDHAQLADDLRRESDRLLALCADRRLVLLALVPEAGAQVARDRFPRQDVAALHAWLRENALALGVRECGAGGAHHCYDQLRGPDTLDLSERRFPHIEIIFRHAIVLVANAPDCFAGFAASGRPSIGFGHGGGVAIEAQAGTPGACMDGSPDLVCNDLPQLVRALDGLGACVADAPAGTRPRCAPVAGTGHARALVERVLRLYGHPGILACPR